MKNNGTKKKAKMKRMRKELKDEKRGTREENE